MKFEPNSPPRKFEAGNHKIVTISDIGRLQLLPDEQITIANQRGAELDVTMKEWGYYATPSLNSRLLTFGLRSALVRNSMGRYFVLLIDSEMQGSFETYMAEQELTLALWLDDGEALDDLLLDRGGS